MGNPPCSAKQKNEDGNQIRTTYQKLYASLQNSWVETSTATNKNNLFDSYIRAIRLSADRISDNGVIGFITNNSFIDENAMDGIRQSLLEEFSDIYVLNLKDGIRGKNKAQSVLEGGNIFDITTGITIVLLIKTLNSTGKGNLYYLDIGDGLNKYQKLEKLRNWKGLSGVIPEFKNITPNEKGDWINKRNSYFDELISLGNKKTQDVLFLDYTGGLKTGRDDWAWNFSQSQVAITMKKSIDYYNKHLGDKNVYNDDVSDISWTATLKNRFERGESQSWQDNRVYLGMYRPFTKKYVYYSKDWVDRQYQMSKVFPVSTATNSIISFSNKTGGKHFSTLILNVLPDVNLFVGGSQNLPKYLYHSFTEDSFFDIDEKYSAIRPKIINKISNLNEDDSIYYVYGVFHSLDYREKYYADLSKSFPKISNLKYKDKYVEIGRKLADIHLNYENQLLNGLLINTK